MLEFIFKILNTACQIQPLTLKNVNNRVSYRRSWLILRWRRQFLLEASPIHSIAAMVLMGATTVVTLALVGAMLTTMNINTS
jgi:hypothetical protein